MEEKAELNKQELSDKELQEIVNNTPKDEELTYEEDYEKKFHGDEEMEEWGFD